MRPELQARLDNLVGAFAQSERGLETFGIGSPRILKGYVGKIADLKFEMLDANSGVGKVTRNQVINMPDATGALHPVVVAEKDVDFPVVLNYIFEDGRRVSVNAIKQSPLSKIDGMQAHKFVAKDWAALVGKTVTLDNTGDDEENPVRRPNNANNNILETRPSRFFEFSTSPNGEPAAAPAPAAEAPAAETAS